MANNVLIWIQVLFIWGNVQGIFNKWVYVLLGVWEFRLIIVFYCLYFVMQLHLKVALLCVFIPKWMWLFMCV